MKDNELRGLPVLLYGNKQDVDGAANEEELKKALNLNGIHSFQERTLLLILSFARGFWQGPQVARAALQRYFRTRHGFFVFWILFVHVFPYRHLGRPRMA
jgi:hypothetical protein